MNAFRDFVISFCTVSVVFGGLFLLCPSGKMKQSVRYVFGVLFLVSVLSAVPVISNIAVSSKDFQAERMYETQSSSETVLALTIKTALRQNGITWKNLQIFTDKTADGRIEIYKVLIYTATPGEKIKEILGVISEQCEIEVRNE
ncbi:MAG: hypothetical protein IKI29_06205 [Clostridia bacterium]|nr:hypothetical protein [Clostridia bacterium]